jgi:hypothetical protein
MIAEMTSYYGELKDHDAPPSRNSLRRTSRISELSLDLEDLEDFRQQLTSNNSESGFSLSAWAHEPEATTGNLMAGVSASSLGGFLQYPSLDSVIEDDIEDEYPSSSMLQNSGICQKGENNRPRHHSDDDSPFLLQSSKGSSSSASCLARSRSWDGTLSRSLSVIDSFPAGGDDDEQRPGKKVHFEVPARLENIQEFEKPDFADYNKLYYMAHEIQKMMDDFRQESELDRNVVR